MIIASIDIGTNTVLMLVADVDIRKNIITLANEYRMPRIGQGLRPGGKIAKQKVIALMDILRQYSEIAKRMHAVKVLITATNAFRIAVNATEVKEMIESELHLKVDIVSGEKEALLSYLGVLTNSKLNTGCIVIDIGGGSTEILVGQENKILFRKSFQIGAVSTKEQFLQNDPTTSDELKKIYSYQEKIFHELESINSKGLSAIAIAGTPTTLACIKHNLTDYDEGIIEGSFLSLDDIVEYANILAALSPNSIKMKYGNVMNGREDIIFAGTSILVSVMKKLNLNQIQVSSKGIRYGAIVDFLDGQVTFEK